MVKPLSRQRRVLTRRVKRGSAPITVRQTEEEPEAEVDTPAEALLKRLIKKQVETPAASAKKGIKRQAGYDSDDLGPDPMGSAFGKKGKAKAKKQKKIPKKRKKGVQKLAWTAPVKKQLDYDTDNTDVLVSAHPELDTDEELLAGEEDDLDLPTAYWEDL